MTVFVVMPAEKWPINLEEVRVFTNRTAAQRDAIPGQRTYLEVEVRESMICPTCGR